MNADLMNGTIVMSQNEARKAGRIGTAEYGCPGNKEGIQPLDFAGI